MKWILKIIGGIILFTAFAFALGWVTMWLWNELVPGLFNGPTIRYWEAVGLMVLGRLLVGGFKGGGRCKCGHSGSGRGGYWKQRWEQKMENMSPEEREKFISGMQKCSWWEKKEC